MKRLIKNSDIYQEKELDFSITIDKLKDIAEYFCPFLGISKSNIVVSGDSHTTNVKMGTIKDDGILIYVEFYNDKTGPRINVIMVSIGKELGVETREQNILDDFLHKDIKFENWANKVLDELEEQLNKKF